MDKEHIADHYRNPRNYGALVNATSVGESTHGSCGDRVKIYLICKDNVITDIRFEGEGCMVSQATASLLTDYVKNISCSEAQNLTKADIKKLLNIPIGPVRMLCALVALDALHQALAS